MQNGESRSLCGSKFKFGLRKFRAVKILEVDMFLWFGELFIFYFECL